MDEHNDLLRRLAEGEALSAADMQQLPNALFRRLAPDDLQVAPLNCLKTWLTTCHKAAAGDSDARAAVARLVR